VARLRRLQWVVSAPYLLCIWGVGAGLDSDRNRACTCTPQTETETFQGGNISPGQGTVSAVLAGIDGCPIADF
jgi:hypothetical protein